MLCVKSLMHQQHSIRFITKIPLLCLIMQSQQPSNKDFTIEVLTIHNGNLLVYNPNFRQVPKSDIQGPYPYSTYNGSHYFLTIVDNHSKATWAHVLPHKSNALLLLKSFVVFVEKQFRADMKIIASVQSSKNHQLWSFITVEAFYVRHLVQMIPNKWDSIENINTCQRLLEHS